MISEDMFQLLKHVPRWPGEVTIKELDALKFLNISLLSNLLDEAVECGYLSRSGRNLADILNLRFHLTECGQVALEEYEHAEQERKMAEESLRVAQESVKIAKSAKRAANISAVIACLALLWQIFPFVKAFFETLLPAR